MIIISRIIHTLIVLFLTFCLCYVYYSVFMESVNFWTYGALAAIILEGLLLWLNNGNCPLTKFQKMIGDDKGFFGLILPSRAIPLVTPSFAFFTSLALLLIFVNQV